MNDPNPTPTPQPVRGDTTIAHRLACPAAHSAAWGPQGGVDRAVRTRLALTVVPVLLVFIALSWRLGTIHIVEHESWARLAERQRTASERLPAPRGPIRGANGEMLVQSRARKIVFADLHVLKAEQKDETARKLAELLNVDHDLLRRRMDLADRRVVYLARNVEPEQAEKVAELKIRGVGFEDTFRREYPLGPLGSHVLGWAGTDGGKEGIELALEGLLRGIPGYRTYERDASRRALSRGGDVSYVPEIHAPQPGLDVQLTIHPGLQHVAEDELDAIMEEFQPKGAVALVLDVRTGAILALANRPAYDPNAPASADPAHRRNRALTDVFEPGSTFKTFIAAEALEKKLFRRNERIYCENGAWRVSYRTLHDSHAYGALTFDEVIVHSSNIGAAKEGLRLGIDGVYEAVYTFGFGARTRIDLPGEVSGIVRPKHKWTKDSLLSVPMGQEIAVTPLQLATAYAAMVNGGTLLRPQVIQRIANAKGEELYTLRAEPVRQVISAETSIAMREMLERVVLEGTGRRAWCPEYSVGGKTGTAQKVIGGMYSHEKYVGSFCGFAPVEQPRLVCLVTVDEPDKRLGYYGGTVASPAVREILRRGLKALNVPPRSGEAQELAEREFRARRNGG
ncbi:MAG: penicillin-binding protein 3 [Planctomycetota bacterium]